MFKNIYSLAVSNDFIRFVLSILSIFFPNAKYQLPYESPE